MKKASWFFLFLFVLSSSSLNNSTIATAQEYEPTLGQAGKDVIWVPTENSLVDAMLEMAEVTPDDYVMDLGSGDGRIVIAAAKRGARALGIEYNPDMVELSKQNAAKEGVSDRASFVQADIFESDYSEASVITMYLLPNLNIRLRPTLLELKPGTRIVSHSFKMDEWEPDQSVLREGRSAYLWIVPAKVGGLWIWQNGPDRTVLELTQRFQAVEGTLTLNGENLPLTDLRLRGDRISFAGGENQYSGVVEADRIRGNISSPEESRPWTAVRGGKVQTGKAQQVVK